MTHIEAQGTGPGPQRAGPPLVVTVSASYGAGGSVIAPRLAERLGVRWLDRLVSADAAADVGRPSHGEALSEEEAASTPGSRLFTYLARAVGANGMIAPESMFDHDEELRASAEEEVRALAGEGGVLLGRAGAVVLAGRPATVHLRLDGPLERRARRAAHLEGISLDEARRRLADTDRARTLYVRRLYRADPADPGLYHLVVDTTVLPVDAAIELLAAAVAAFRGGGDGW